MPALPFHGLSDNWFASLKGAINNSTTSIVIDGAGAGAEPATPFYMNISAEAMECTAIAADTPGAGETTLTVVRGALGTAASSHSDNAVVEQNAYAQHWTELQNRLAVIEQMMVILLGGSDGVTRISKTGEEFLVSEQDTPDMTVLVLSGAGLVSFQPIATYTDFTTPTITAPITNPRIDIIQIDQYGVITRKAGTEAGSPTAPTVDANNMKLAEIYLRVGATSIKNTDDTTNGYITDSRVFI
jgi:hypothetical protein